MSRLWLRLTLVVVLSATAIGGAALGVASGASVESMLEGALQPSSAPSLLGPITEAGRKGWACKPEQAAAAQDWHRAELPDATAP
ncbi:MAG TPA: hypothetical protein VKT72_06765 [Candidatus Baltobacteraceae bacterium]|nr:hypothetical protein [Candidatus Baltobacteraceae bacterium]